MKMWGNESEQVVSDKLGEPASLSPKGEIETAGREPTARRMNRQRYSCHGNMEALRERWLLRAAPAFLKEVSLAKRRTA